MTEVLRTRKCLAAFAKTRPDRFETRPDRFEKFYSHGNLNVPTEGAFWLAANKVLESH